jgi:hypothetical protein
VTLLLAVGALATALPALATPPSDGDTEWQRYGAVSRHLWVPRFARLDIAGIQLRPGLALGLRGSVQANLGRRFAPALTVDLGQQRSVALLHAGDRGTMIVFQFRP